MCVSPVRQHLAVASVSPSIQTSCCLFGFALANTPLGLPSALRTIPGSGLSLAQACCLAHWRSLQANLSPTRTQEDLNHSAPPSHHSETLACFNQARPTVSLKCQQEGFSVCVCVCVCILQHTFQFDWKPSMMQQVHLFCKQTGMDRKKARVFVAHTHSQ